MTQIFYGIPKIHKLDTPVRPIVSSHGSCTYGVAKVFTKILKPLVGKSPHHVHSTQDFVEQANKVTLILGECLSSYDVTALFTAVPVDPALGIIKDLLKKYTQGKNSVTGPGHNSLTGILPQKHLLFFPREVLWTSRRCGHGVPSKPHSS